MDEPSRLSALSSYQIMDTLPQKELDEVTELASIICGVPISLLTLLDADRQWFKSKVGLDASETAREFAFCNYTIQSADEVMVVHDSFEDERFKLNPLVTGNPNIRFYAGAPLVTSEGHALGALCVIDCRPRTLTEEQKRALKLLSKKVIDIFELRKAQIESNRLFKSDSRRLFALSEHSPDFITTVNDSLKITYANKAHDGIGRGELLGMFILEIIEPTFRKDFIFHCTNVFQEGEQTNLDLKLTNRAGNKPWVTCRIAPLKEDNGAVFNILVVCTDITERKLAEEDKKKHIRSMEEVMFMISHQLRSPICRAMGLAGLLSYDEVSYEDKLECIRHINTSISEVEKFSRELSMFVESLKTANHGSGKKHSTDGGLSL
ncbi:GAF domain-containing protein [Pontibacter silvestris]|uniref:GAF domain-containing protein n=1 Tax=Pontibacter silvestris TaxID=2305183 RepID=A0ABW4WU47_9BACT|nr:GAF domain-containing protein [Pontibacter silvestris]MCC9138575.1 PAS domain-containing protein [Pontibacter silvestris]